MDVQQEKRPTCVWRATLIQQLADEARNTIACAILHEREEEVVALLTALNANMQLPVPGADLFTALRLVETEVSGEEELTDMLQAIEEGDTAKFAGACAVLYASESELGPVLAAFAFDPDDTGREPETIAGCQHAIRQLATKWRVALASEVSS